jgi:hypothetical protein
MFKENNEFEGITFYTVSKKYSAALTIGRDARTIGFFDTLQEAIDARRAALQSQARNR